MTYKKWLVLCTLAILILGLAARLGLADVTQGEVKWSQPPVRLIDIDPKVTDPALIYGWDQTSMTDQPALPDEPIAADDFRCDDPRPVTDIHWWGSYPGVPPGTTPNHPDRFIIRFWTDVKAGDDPDPGVYWSHPGEEIWSITCENYQVEPVGLDVDVHEYHDTGEIYVVDEAFQYNQRFAPDEYFQQVPGNVYWVSIQAQYDNPAPEDEWGWKTRPHFWNDDAVIALLPAAGGDIAWDPLDDVAGEDWDMAYELTVPEPSSFVLLGLGAVGLVAYGWRRRRRA